MHSQLERSVHFRGKKCPKMYQKINRSVKMPWYRPSMRVACSGSWAPDGRLKSWLSRFVNTYRCIYPVFPFARVTGRFPTVKSVFRKDQTFQIRFFFLVTADGEQGWEESARGTRAEAQSFLFCTINFLMHNFTLSLVASGSKERKTTAHGLEIASENSRHFAMPPLVSPLNDVWETSVEIPYWGRVTT